MRPSRRDIVIATRRSKLALVQAEMVGRALQKLNPNVQMRYVTLESEGDRVTDHPLASLGGKGLFTRSIEQALLEGKADIAVHSMKDVPTQPTEGLVITAVPRRLDVRDLLVSRLGIAITDLPQGATLGTCSPRRAAQVLRLRPDLKVLPMRGNVDTRLSKVLNQNLFDATLLAAAGLARLGIAHDLLKPISVADVLPAAGQAALAIQCRVDDHTSIRRCLPLNDAESNTAVNAERSVVAALGADCHSPVAVLCEPVERLHWRLRARVLSTDGKACLEVDETGPAKTIRKLEQRVAKQLIEQGAREWLRHATAELSAA